jgi:predicted acyltransferase
MSQNTRLVSLDVLRGMTIAGMILVNNPGNWDTIYAPLDHAEWHGCTPTDWVFPFFLFMVGVAIPLALGRRKDEGQPMGMIYRKIVLRSLIIFGIGLFLGLFPGFYFRDKANPLIYFHYTVMSLFMVSIFFREVWNQPQYQTPGYQRYRKLISYFALAMAAIMVVIGVWNYDLHTLRIPGVLQRIAVVYLASGLLFINFSPRALFWIAVGLLLGYWGVMTLIPVPGGIAPNLEPETNLGAWFDRLVFTTDHLWKQSKTWDPEGLFSTFPAIATGISGMLVGEWLRSKRSDYEKVSGLLAIGAILFAVSLLWNPLFPLNKKLWTSSYVLYTSGIAMLFLGVIYWLVDIKGWKAWSKPFQIYGMNAMFAFILSGIVAKLLGFYKLPGGENGELQSLSAWLYKSFYITWLPPYNASLAYALSNVLFVFGACWILYRFRIFMKV